MKLYPYQQRVKALLQRGRSVILQAPTGSGKTRAALAPFIESFYDAPATAFPTQCIYSVPMRVLANQFHVEYDALAQRYERRFRQEMQVRIQTGERSEDRDLTGDLIFATIDQSLSSALAVPYSLTPGLANRNAGAFFSSYLVFDEFHLFPVAENGGAEGALITTLQLLERVKGIVPFILMTATFSSTMLDELAARLDAEVVTVSAAEYHKIATRDAEQPRQRRFAVHDTELSADAVLATHNTRSIVICNQVGRAQALYEALQHHPHRGDAEIILLHSRFLPADRSRKEAHVRREFGKNTSEREARSLILVATQVVEVGLDITCENLHTEIAPANAVLQRAGRCARYPGEQGMVHVYNVPLREPRREGQEAQPDYLPYPRTLCEASWSSFQARHAEVVDFQEEQRIIDEVHTQADRQLLDAMQRQAGLIWNDIFAAMETHDRAHRRNLIRHIDSIAVLAAPDPDALGNPFAAQGFSLFRGSVHKLWRDLDAYGQMWQGDADDEEPWLMALPSVDERDPENPGDAPVVHWQPIYEPEMLNGTNIVAINSAFCAYDEALGFRIVPPEEANGWSSSPGAFPQGNNRPGYGYQLERYTEHIETMLDVYRREFSDDYAYVQQRLANEWDLPADALDRAVRLAIAGHDLAKLDVRWQKWVRLYQAAIEDPIDDPNFMAVHTFFEPTFPEHHQAQRSIKLQRPHHAGESAVAVARIVAELAGSEPLARAVLTAIARHHSTGNSNFTEYTLHPAAAESLQQALAAAELPQPRASITNSDRRGGSLEPLLICPNDFEQLLLYLYIVRLLRLCDGLSQER